jgi:homoserine kinase type II
VFDLAVTCNDWCIDLHSGRLETPLLQALLGGYREVRVPLPAEARAWPLMLRAAALRFWLSRLDDSLAPRPAESVQPKDPAHFERILQQRRTGVPPLVQG